MKYNPHDYQTYATNFILEHPIAAVFLDMGLGKSVITLTAIMTCCLTVLKSARYWSLLPCALPEIHGLLKLQSGITSNCFGIPPLLALKSSVWRH